MSDPAMDEEVDAALSEMRELLVAGGSLYAIYESAYSDTEYKELVVSEQIFDFHLKEAAKGHYKILRFEARISIR